MNGCDMQERRLGRPGFWSGAVFRAGVRSAGAITGLKRGKLAETGQLMTTASGGSGFRWSLCESHGPSRAGLPASPEPP